MANNREGIKAMVRQFLHDELKESGEEPTFKNDELDLPIDECLVEVSEVCPYEDRETVVSTGSKEIDISSIEGLIGDKVEKAEYPIDSDPPEYCNVSIFGNILRLDIDSAPASGNDIYLYCHKVHQLTDSVSTLGPELEIALKEGLVWKVATSWLNEMRKTIVPASVKWYEEWVDKRYGIYQRNLLDIAKPKAWEF